MFTFRLSKVEISNNPLLTSIPEALFQLANIAQIDLSANKISQLAPSTTVERTRERKLTSLLYGAMHLWRHGLRREGVRPKVILCVISIQKPVTWGEEVRKFEFLRDVING